MFGATGAAVVTSPEALTGRQTPVRLTSPPPTEVQEAAKSAGQLAAAEKDLEVVRATTVARGVARQKLAARVEDARRATLASHVARAHRWQLPITHPVKSSPFGYRWGRLHAGEDFAVSIGTPLASMSTGTVIFAGVESGFGNLIQIRYWDGTISYFGHMSSISATVGQAVQPGEIVGLSGNTGHSTGPHLHLEIHPAGGVAIDPLPWLTAHHIKT